MSLAETGVRAMSDRLPKVISPKTHAILDYAMIASFGVAGALMWRSSKRAAIASWACGAAEGAIALLTDYPGGIAKVISFPAHGRIEAAMSGVAAILPTVLGLGRGRKSIFFRRRSIAMAVVTGMTDFEAMERQHPRRAAELQALSR